LGRSERERLITGSPDARDGKGRGRKRQTKQDKLISIILGGRSNAATRSRGWKTGIGWEVSLESADKKVKKRGEKRKTNPKLMIFQKMHGTSGADQN